MDTLRQICYIFLAPLSVICEAVLVYGFLRLKMCKDHPEVLIFWQCVAQIILDIHWFTGVETLHNTMSKDECLFLGAFSLYFYYLSWNYILILAIEILLKILCPLKSGHCKRMIYYHLLAHLSSFSIFLSVMLSGTNGQSVMKTCFVEHGSICELFVFFPVIFHFPLCTGIVLYCIYISFGTFIAAYLKYQMMVIAAFSVAWVPIGIIHGLNYKPFGINVPLWAVYIACILGAPSGFFVFLARVMQKGLLKKIVISICSASNFQNELLAQLSLSQDKRQDSDLSYSEFFDMLEINEMKEIIKAIQFAIEKSISPETKYIPNSEQDSCTWDFNCAASNSQIKIDQLSIKTFEKIMQNSNLSYSSLYNSLEVDEDFEEFKKRIIVNTKDKSFVYYTKDLEFMIKSITSNELMCLNSIRDKYADRICSSEGSYLTKIFGLFKVNIQGSKVIRIIIMENLGSSLNNPITFRLNGYLGTKIESLRLSTHNFNDISREFIYDDKDFSEIIGNFTINNTELLSIICKIKRDTRVLASNLLIEYDLSVMTEQSLSLKSTMIEKRFVASSENFVIFIAIDNFLQVFNAQTKIKKKDRKEFNKYFGMEEYGPKSYRKRFLYMVKSVFKAQSVI